jgi:hypothetical protein
VDIKECDAPDSNSTTAEVSLMKNIPMITSGASRASSIVFWNVLRACVLEYQGSWDKNLPWAKFSNNNSYQRSLKMAPFEVLYG